MSRDCPEPPKEGEAEAREARRAAMGDRMGGAGGGGDRFSAPRGPMKCYK